MKESLKKVLVSIVFLSVLVVTLFKVHNVFVYSHENTKFLNARDAQIKSFENGEIDAYYVGGSKVIRGINPIIVWNESGIKGVTLATITQPPIVTREIVKKYVEINKPKYVFIDPSGIQTDSSLTGSPTYRYSEGFEFLDNHKKTIEVLLEMKKDFPNDDITEFVFPLYRDHTRWKNLSEKDFKLENNYLEHTLGYSNTFPITEKSPYLSNKKYYEDYNYEIKYDEVALRVYTEIVEYLKEENIETYIIALPDLYDGSKGAAYSAFAKDNDLVFLDFSIRKEFIQIGFDEYGDFYDDGHLSPSGAEKFSKYFGDFIRKMKLDTGEHSQKYEALYEDYLNDSE